MAGIKEAKIISRVKKESNCKRFVLILLAVAVFQFAAVEILLISSGKSDVQVRTDYLIILGAGIKGETLSLSLHERLMVGLEYLEKYPDTKVIVSGGQGRGEAITEAEAMRRFLVSKGIDSSRILMEDRATSTMENFTYSRQLVEQETGQPLSEVTFVTNSFHILRSRMLAGRNGLKAHALSGKTPKQVVIQTYFREYFALFKSLLVDRL